MKKPRAFRQKYGHMEVDGDFKYPGIYYSGAYLDLQRAKKLYTWLGNAIKYLELKKARGGA